VATRKMRRGLNYFRKTRVNDVALPAEVAIVALT
jgi:hypothetical protein